MGHSGSFVLDEGGGGSASQDVCLKFFCSLCFWVPNFVHKGIGMN